MKRINARYEKESEIAITGKNGWMIDPIIRLENSHNESCIVDVSFAFRTLQGDKGLPKAEEIRDCFLVLERNAPHLLKIFGEEQKNNDVTLRLFDLLKDHEVKTSLLLPGEKKELELFFDGKRVKPAFTIDITITCTFEDKHVEKFDMYICVM